MDEKAGPKRGKKWVLVIALFPIGAIPLILGAIMFGRALEPGCDNDLAQEFPSPNGQLKAVVFRRDCGATTSFTMNVSILPAAQSLPNQPGNTFVKDSAEPPVAQWIDDTHLLISETWPGRIFLQKTSVGKVRMSYKEGT